MKKKTFLVFILFLIWLNYLLSCQLPSRTNGLHLRPLIPDRYCYLKWRYITGWLTAPFVAEFTLLQLYQVLGYLQDSLFPYDTDS